jgi:hypothetical protein
MSLNQDFQERAHQICKDTRHIGWGFHEILCDIYTYFDELEFLKMRENQPTQSFLNRMS